MPIFTAALLFALQNDSDATAGGGSLSHGATALMDLLTNIGPVAMGVLLVLLFASLYSWTVILGKMSTFSKATKESKRFIRTFRKASRLQEIAAQTPEFKASPLAQVFDEVYETYKRQTGGSGPPRNMTPLERSAQTAGSEAVTALEQRMTWLATIAATSPFVGLFGTVMGILNAFKGISQEKATGLAAVAGGIAEALVTTAFGLLVAIPAVMMFNYLTGRVEAFDVEMDNSSSELIDYFLKRRGAVRR